MTNSPVFYDDGCDRYVWCVDEQGAIRVWPLTGMGVGDLGRWGWRLATENEVMEYLPTLLR